MVELAELAQQKEDKRLSNDLVKLAELAQQKGDKRLSNDLVKLAELAQQKEDKRLSNDLVKLAELAQQKEGKRLSNDLVKLAELAQQKKDKWLSDDFVELAALAQHYGVLTRLLDWSSDLFVALYFASIGAIKSGLRNNGIFTEEKMVIWALNSQYIQSLQSTTNRIPLNFVVPPYYKNPRAF